MGNNNDKIKELEENVKYDIDRISDFPSDINLDEEIEITKTKILYLIYNELKKINEKLDKINDGRKA
jgi:RNA polymerase-binding transcription factor DksA